MAHRTSTVVYSPREAGFLACVDFDGVLLSSLDYEDLHHPEKYSGENWASEMVKVKSPAPAVVFQRGSARPQIVDGHHRAFSFLAHGLPLVAELHSCSCSSDRLDFFGLCDKVNETVRRTRDHGPA